MRKYSRSKGQWFLISAVIASGAFLVISVLFKDFFIVKPSYAAQSNEEQYYWAMKNSLEKTIALSESQPCLQLERDLNETVHFLQQSMLKSGKLVDVYYGINCPQKKVNFFLIALTSPTAQLWEGERPEIKNVRNYPNLEIEFENALKYDINVNITVYSAVNNESKKLVFEDGKSVFSVKFENPKQDNMYVIVENHLITGGKKFLI